MDTAHPIIYEIIIDIGLILIGMLAASVLMLFLSRLTEISGKLIIVYAVLLFIIILIVFLPSHGLLPKWKQHQDKQMIDHHAKTQHVVLANPDNQAHPRKKSVQNQPIIYAVNTILYPQQDFSEKNKSRNLLADGFQKESRNLPKHEIINDTGHHLPTYSKDSEAGTRITYKRYKKDGIVYIHILKVEPQKYNFTTYPGKKIRKHEIKAKHLKYDEMNHLKQLNNIKLDNYINKSKPLTVERSRYNSESNKTLLDKIQPNDRVQYKTMREYNKYYIKDYIKVTSVERDG